jgi:hypothetical protein
MKNHAVNHVDNINEYNKFITNKDVNKLQINRSELIDQINSTENHSIKQELIKQLEQLSDNTFNNINKTKNKYYDLNNSNKEKTIINLSSHNLSELPYESLIKYKSITELNISYNSIYDLYEGNTKTYELPLNLINLNMKNNKMEYMPKRIPKSLKYLNIHNNQITKLSKFNNNLTNLNLGYNRIKNIEIDNFPTVINELLINNNRLMYFSFSDIMKNNTIEKLDVSNNFIYNDVDFISNIIKYFNCSDNRIKNICKLPELIKYFNCSSNLISEIQYFPRTLHSINISNNNILELSKSILCCNNLKTLNYEGNTDLIVSENILEYIDELFHNVQLNQEKLFSIKTTINNDNLDNNVNNIFNDPQNVHNQTIQKDIDKNIKILINDELNNSELTSEIALLEFKNFIKDKNEKDKISNNKNGNSLLSTVTSYVTSYWNNDDNKNSYNILKYLCSLQNKHVRMNVTFEEIFIKVWDRICTLDDENKNNIIEILNNDLPEIKQVCFTGRISGLINCLVPFFDDIEVHISDQDQIQAIYSTVTNKIQQEYKIDEDHALYSFISKMLFDKMITSSGITGELYKEWMEVLNENINDLLEEDNLILNKYMNSLSDSLIKQLNSYYSNILNNDNDNDTEMDTEMDITKMSNVENLYEHKNKNYNYIIDDD